MGLGSSQVIQYRGRFLHTMREIDPAIQASSVANRAFLAPIVVPRLVRADRLVFRIINGADSCKAGIYADNSDTPVGGKLFLDAGTVYTGPFLTFDPVTFTINQQFSQGLYWIALMFKSTGITHFYNALPFSGLPDPFNGCYYDAPSFALIDPCPAVTADNTISPNALLRVAQVYE